MSAASTNHKTSLDDFAGELKPTLLKSVLIFATVIIAEMSAASTNRENVLKLPLGQSMQVKATLGLIILCKASQAHHF
jgi:hypothetical protein